MKYTKLSDFYTGREWEAFRLNVINNRETKEGNIICDYCKKAIVKKYDCILHHKEHLTLYNVNDAMVSLNPDNINIVHHACHNKIHNKLGKIDKHVYIVYGSPFAGKIKYVNKVKEDGDLVIDIDSIWECVSGCERYIKPSALKENVFAIKNNLIDQVKYRIGKWSNAYIIGTYPLEGERERLRKTLDAELIYIDTDKEKCINNIDLLNNDSIDKSELKKFVEDWWEKFSK